MFQDCNKISTLAVTWGLFEPEKKLKEARPDYLVNTPKELEELIGELGAY